MKTLTSRSNEQWLTDLGQPGSERDAALADLRKVLLHGLKFVLKKRDVDPSLAEDFAQDALLKILDKLDTFQNKSKFTTWANTIAVNVAFGELRRQRWKDVSLDQMVEDFRFQPERLVDETVDAETQSKREDIVKLLHLIIDEQLTERQREGLVAEMAGQMPTQEIAQHMGMSRNALYKLLHDGRKKLKQGLLGAGLTPEAVHAAFDL